MNVIDHIKEEAGGGILLADQGIFASCVLNATSLALLLPMGLLLHRKEAQGMSMPERLGSDVRSTSHWPFRFPFYGGS